MFWKRLGQDEKPRCSFCNKGEDVAGQLISSPRNDDLSVPPPCYICRECVGVCNAKLDDRRHNQEDPSSARNADEGQIVLGAGVPPVMRDIVMTSRELPRDKVTIQLDARWASIVRSPLFWIMAPLQCVAFSFAPLFLYWGGKGFFHYSSEWTIVTSSYAIIYAIILVVVVFYMYLGTAVIHELRKKNL
jgi:hypothetical protein